MHDLKAVSTLFDLRGDFVHGYSYGSVPGLPTFIPTAAATSMTPTVSGWIRRDSVSATSSSA